MDFSRCVLYSLLESLTRRFEPVVVSRTWVDDVVQRVEGSRRTVVAALVSAGQAFGDGVKGLGLQIASKSSVVSTRFDIAKELQQKFAAQASSSPPSTSQLISASTEVRSRAAGQRRHGAEAQRRGACSASTGCQGLQNSRGP